MFDLGIGWWYTKTEHTFYFGGVYLRPLAEIRRHILLQRLYERIRQLGKASARHLKASDIQLLHVETRQFDVLVEYKYRGLIYEAMFTIPMLDAEIEGWLAESPFVLKEKQMEHE